MHWIVEIENEVWLAPWHGDPGRTLVKGSAREFWTDTQAKRALTLARKYHPFKKAKIILVE